MKNIDLKQRIKHTDEELMGGYTGAGITLLAINQMVIMEALIDIQNELSKIKKDYELPKIESK
jgi:hypothetical protein